MTTTNAPGERKIVTFSLGTQIFGIDMSSLIEIREWDEPTPLPGVPDYIKGVTNLRGTVVPVIGLATGCDRRRRYGHPGAPSVACAYGRQIEISAFARCCSCRLCGPRADGPAEDQSGPQGQGKQRGRSGR